jgi:hypothetical protein
MGRKLVGVHVVCDWMDCRSLLINSVVSKQQWPGNSQQRMKITPGDFNNRVKKKHTKPSTHTGWLRLRSKHATAGGALAAR